MKKVDWTDDLSVGIGLIDEQHKVLIQDLNTLTRAIEQRQGPKEIGATLGFLIDYTDFHFSTEEQHMADNGYSELDAHRAQHNEFKTNLSNLEDEFLEDGATHVLADTIDTLLVNWLLNHIRGVDVKFGAFLKSNGITFAKEG